jgi:undecaprenyl diphosphate synthase
MKQSSLQRAVHVGIIMDGNGRWAQARGLPRFAGHCAGAEALRTVVHAAPALGVQTLTVYAFSADNWKRPIEEVVLLFELLARYLEEQGPPLREAGVRLSAIGRRDRISERLLDAIERAEEMTLGGNRLHLRLAIDYSARETIYRAAGGWRVCSGQREEFDKLLAPSGPLDLLIRTGGEQRLSDFLLWECAYAELLFTRRLWPDFLPADLQRALREFASRTRRFGGIADDAVARTEAVEALPEDRWLH